MNFLSRKSDAISASGRSLFDVNMNDYLDACLSAMLDASNATSIGSVLSSQRCNATPS